MYDEASEQRNWIAARYSSLDAMRPRGMWSTSRSTKSSGWSTRTPPGESALQRTPRSAQYVARYRVRPIRPCLTTEYVTGFTGCASGGRLGSRYRRWSGAITPRSLAMFRITPAPLSAIPVPNSRAHRYAPVSPTAMSASHCSSGKFSSRDSRAPSTPPTLGSLAALLIRASTRPSFSMASSRAARTDSPLVKSQPIGCASSSRAACSRRSPGRSSSATRAPTSIRATACSRPSMPAPPVIAATRPVMSKARGSSATVLASVRDENGSGRERGALGGEEQDRVGDLLRRAEALHRHLVLDHRLDALAVLLEELLPAAAGEDDVAGRDQVHADAVRPEPARQVARVADERRLGRAVGERRAVEVEARDGADDHDRPSVAHGVLRGLAHVNRRHQVLVEHLAPGLRADGVVRRPLAPSRVRHRDVQASERLGGGPHGLPGLHLAAQVRRYRGRRAHLGAGALKRGLVASHQGHPCALRGDPLGDGEADPAARAAPQHRLAVQLQVHAAASHSSRTCAASPAVFSTSRPGSPRATCSTSGLSNPSERSSPNARRRF